MAGISKTSTESLSPASHPGQCSVRVQTHQKPTSKNNWRRHSTVASPHIAVSQPTNWPWAHPQRCSSRPAGSVLVRQSKTGKPEDSELQICLNYCSDKAGFFHTPLTDADTSNRLQRQAQSGFSFSSCYFLFWWTDSLSWTANQRDYFPTGAE